jgi:hypothetical protein
MSYSLPGLNIYTVFPELGPRERQAKRDQLPAMDSIRSGLKPSALARGEANLSRMYESRGVAPSKRRCRGLRLELALAATFH